MDEILEGAFNPDVERLADLDPESPSAECLKEDILNHHYRMAMSGESTKNSDHRKKVKVKPPWPKDPLKGKIPRENAASTKKKKNGKSYKSEKIAIRLRTRPNRKLAIMTSRGIFATRYARGPPKIL